MSLVTGLTVEDIRAKKRELKERGQGPGVFALWLADAIQQAGNTLVDFMEVHRALDPGFRVDESSLSPAVLKIIEDLRSRRDNYPNTLKSKGTA